MHDRRGTSSHRQPRDVHGRFIRAPVPDRRRTGGFLWPRYDANYEITGAFEPGNLSSAAFDYIVVRDLAKQPVVGENDEFNANIKRLAQAMESIINENPELAAAVNREVAINPDLWAYDAKEYKRRPAESKLPHAAPAPQYETKRGRGLVGGAVNSAAERAWAEVGRLSRAERIRARALSELDDEEQKLADTAVSVKARATPFRTARFQPLPRPARANWTGQQVYPDLVGDRDAARAAIEAKTIAMAGPLSEAARNRQLADAMRQIQASSKNNPLDALRSAYRVLNPVWAVAPNEASNILPENIPMGPGRPGIRSYDPTLPGARNFYDTRGVLPAGTPAQIIGPQFQDLGRPGHTGIDWGPWPGGPRIREFPAGAVPPPLWRPGPRVGPPPPPLPPRPLGPQGFPGPPPPFRRFNPPRLPPVWPRGRVGPHPPRAPRPPPVYPDLNLLFGPDLNAAPAPVPNVPPPPAQPAGMAANVINPAAHAWLDAAVRNDAKESKRSVRSPSPLRPRAPSPAAVVVKAAKARPEDLVDKTTEQAAADVLGPAPSLAELDEFGDFIREQEEQEAKAIAADQIMKDVDRAELAELKRYQNGVSYLEAEEAEAEYRRRKANDDLQLAAAERAERHGDRLMALALHMQSRGSLVRAQAAADRAEALRQAAEDNPDPGFFNRLGQAGLSSARALGSLGSTVLGRLTNIAANSAVSGLESLPQLGTAVVRDASRVVSRSANAARTLAALAAEDNPLATSAPAPLTLARIPGAAPLVAVPAAVAPRPVRRPRRNSMQMTVQDPSLGHSAQFQAARGHLAPGRSARGFNFRKRGRGLLYGRGFVFGELAREELAAQAAGNNDKRSRVARRALLNARRRGEKVGGYIDTGQSGGAGSAGFTSSINTENPIDGVWFDPHPATGPLGACQPYPRTNGGWGADPGPIGDPMWQFQHLGDSSTRVPYRTVVPMPFGFSQRVTPDMRSNWAYMRLNAYQPGDTGPSLRRSMTYSPGQPMQGGSWAELGDKWANVKRAWHERFPTPHGAGLTAGMREPGNRHWGNQTSRWKGGVPDKWMPGLLHAGNRPAFDSRPIYPPWKLARRPFSGGSRGGSSYGSLGQAMQAVNQWNESHKLYGRYPGDPRYGMSPGIGRGGYIGPPPFRYDPNHPYYRDRLPARMQPLGLGQTGGDLTAGQKWALGIGVPATFFSLAAGQTPGHDDAAIPALAAAAASALGTAAAYRHYGRGQTGGDWPRDWPGPIRHGSGSELHCGYADTGPPQNPRPPRITPQRSPCTPGGRNLELGLLHGGRRGRGGYMKNRLVVSCK